MAINDVTLTAGMRSTLLSLQQTANLFDRTQTRLATGKKVNTALDNPISYFAAQAHMSRSNDIAALKDGMTEAVQTIKSADSGIKAINDLIDSAKALAKSALGTAANQVKLTIGSVTAGTTIAIGGTTYTATDADVTPGSNQFNISDDASTTASNLASLINGTAETTDMVASANGTTVTIWAKSASFSLTQASQVATGATGKIDIQTDINGNDVFSERAALAQQYNNIMTQIDSIANSSGYRGVNLLRNENLNVAFEGTSLTVKGFSATASDLKLSTKATDDASYFAWTTNADINTDLSKLDNAISTLRSQSSKLSSNLSIINVQQDFAAKMVNTLTEGADKLTLADMNEEGANMLTLQTRQALSTTALSLASQAAQSVLRMF